MQFKENVIQHCSFCQRTRNEVHKLIVGSEVAICNICFESIKDLLDKENSSGLRIKNPKTKILSPLEIKNQLDEVVIGQDDAKIALSVAVHNHYKRLQKNSQKVKVEKSNVLLLGPTGSGKTLLVRAIAELLDVPMVIGDATTLTQAGYVGDDVEILLSKLVQEANGDIELAQRGIIFIDEIDKIAKSGDSSTLGRDISGEGVQQSLLKMIEGHVVAVPPEPSRKLGFVDTVDINTSQILFVCSGAFVGLDKILESRQQGNTAGIGFAASVDKNKKLDWDGILAQDLVKYGIIPELIGRLPIITYTEALTQAQMIKVLTDPKDSIIKQYQELFSPIKLKFTLDGLEAVASKAIKLGTGARSLRSILEKKLTPLQFKLSHGSSESVSSVTITKEFIEGTTDPLMKLKKLRKKGNQS